MCKKIEAEDTRFISIMERVESHYNEAKTYFNYNNIVGIFLQGSQNYGLDTEESDVDTKLIVTPTFREIAMNARPHSTTHIRENEEHIDFKDIRLYIDTFRKQNLNFLEILFTDYALINGMYATEWGRLCKDRERIARMNPYRAVKSMKGIAMEKYHAMEHEYPSKVEVLKKYGYDPKQLHHLLRVDEYLTRYITGESYEVCLHPRDSEYFKFVKKGMYELNVARGIADQTIAHVCEIADNFCKENKEEVDSYCDELLKDVQYQIMKISVEKELN